MSQRRLFQVIAAGDYSDQASEFQRVIDELRDGHEFMSADEIAEKVEALRDEYALPSHALILRPCTPDGEPAEDFEAVVAAMQGLPVLGVVEVVEASERDRPELA